MNRWTLVAILIAMALGTAGLTFSMRATAQPAGQMPMTPPRGQPMQQPTTGQQTDQMMQQMLRQIAQMDATIKALRAQLTKMNPRLLTGQQRPIYEYLKALQTHLETMAAAMRMHNMMMQGMMGMMMGQSMPMRPPAAGQQMDQMMRQMAQMDATVRALRTHLDKVNPDLLTAQERLIYEYLRTLQAHLEMMQGMMMPRPGSGR